MKSALFDSSNSSVSDAEPLDQPYHNLYETIMKRGDSNGGKGRRILILAASKDVPAKRLSEALASAAAAAGSTVLHWNCVTATKKDKQTRSKHTASLAGCMGGYYLPEDAFTWKGGNIWELADTGNSSDGSSLAPSESLDQLSLSLSHLFDLILMSAEDNEALKNNESDHQSGQIVDGVILVAHKGKTRKDDLTKVLSSVKGLPLVGTVMLD